MDATEARRSGLAANLAQSPPAAPPPPAMARSIVLLTLGASLATYFFVIYCISRGLIGGFGSAASSVIKAFIATAAMAGFVIWLAPLTELAEIWFSYRRPAIRIRRGLCPACGQAAPPGETAGRRCPECGAGLDIEPQPWQFGWSAVRRFAILCAVAVVLGALVGEAWLAGDEERFEAEVTAGNGLPRERPRAWPADFARLSFDGEVFTASGVPESKPIPGWRPKRQRDAETAPR
jgi:hypothetical protein